MGKSTAKKQEKQAKKERLYSLFVIVLILIAAGLCLLIFLRSCDRLPVTAKGLFSTIEVKKIRLVNSKHDFTLRRSADIWLNDRDATFPVDQGKTAALLDAMATLPISSTISGDVSASAYGLAEPAVILTMTMTNGEQKTLSIGSEEEQSGGRYFTFTDKKGILMTTADLGGLLILSEYDLIDVPQPPTISGSDVEGIRIVNHALEETVTLNRYPGLRPDIDLSDTCIWFSSFPDGWERPANEDNIPYLLAAVESLRYEFCVGWNESDAFLSACGFDNPELELSIRYHAETEERTLDLVLSGSTQGGAYYFAREQESRNVYLIPAPVGIFIESATLDNMTSKNPGYVGMDHLAAFSAEIGSRSIQGTINRTGDAARYLVNGAEASQYDFTMLYAAFFDLYGSAVMKEPPRTLGETVFTLKLELAREDIPRELTYAMREYDGEQYAFSTDDRVWMLVSKTKFESMQTAVETLLKNCKPE